jgi:hypothetical protein
MAMLRFDRIALRSSGLASLVVASSSAGCLPGDGYGCETWGSVDLTVSLANAPDEPLRCEYEDGFVEDGGVDGGPRVDACHCDATGRCRLLFVEDPEYAPDEVPLTLTGERSGRVLRTTLEPRWRLDVSTCHPGATDEITLDWNQAR